MLAKRESFKKSNDSRGVHGGGNSGSGSAGTTSAAATDRAPIKKEPTTTAVPGLHPTDATATTARVRNPVPTFSEGEQREKLKQKQDEESKASGQLSKGLVHSSMTAAAAAAAAAAGPTMASGGDDDLGPEGAEAG